LKINDIEHARHADLLTTPAPIDRYEAMVDAMREEAVKAKAVMNDGLDKDTRYGPINNRMQLARVSHPFLLLLCQLWAVCLV